MFKSRSYRFGASCVAVASFAGAVSQLAAASPALAVLIKPSITAGAVAIGTTAYPIPVGARFVATTGNDAAAGTQVAPFKTIARAINVAASGATIVIRGGTYREALTITNEQLTIQPFPNEAVYIRGSKIVSAFGITGKTWTLNNWTYQFPRQMPSLVLGTHPMANAPDMVYYDGVALKQRPTLALATGRSFYVDYASSQLTIGVDPAGHLVEASAQTVGLNLVNADHSLIRGLQFDQWATPINSHGAVIDQSDGVTFENNIFRDNATAGLSLRGTNSTVINNSFIANGQLGVHAFTASHLMISDNRLSGNNSEYFDEYQEAGGMKIVASTYVVARQNYVLNNNGNGIWFDVDASNAMIIRNATYANSRNGIQYEISDHGVIAGNLNRNNDSAGIQVIESTNVDVYNNVSNHNGVGGAAWEGPRPHVLQNVVFANNVWMDGFATSNRLLDIDDKTHTLSAAQMSVTADYDAFCRATANVPPTVAAVARTAAGQATFGTVAEMKLGSTLEAHGIPCEGTVALAFFASRSSGNFNLGATSVGRGAGVALPPQVASALGVAGGVPVDVGLL